MAEPILIGISGKKQSGKSSLCNYLQARFSGLHPSEIVQNEDGSVGVVENSHEMSIRPEFKQQVKIYNFADSLKELVCRRVLGLSEAQVRGSDEDKNSLTQFKWDNMPENILKEYSKGKEEVQTGKGEGGDVITTYLVKYRSGLMTAREVMQIVGTDIFRRYFSDSVWVDSAFRTIEADEPKPLIALIADTRFKSEVKAVLDRGGYVIRLERKISDDTHPSEIELDDYDWSQSDRCLVIHNGVDDDLMTDMNRKNDEATAFIDSVFGE